MFHMRGVDFISFMAKSPRSAGPWQALSLAWELGYMIAVPVVLLALGGRLLDRKFGTSPWLLLAGIILSIVASSAAVTMRVRRIT